MDATLIALKPLPWFITRFFLKAILLFLRVLTIKLILNAKIWNQEESYNTLTLHNIFGVQKFQSKTKPTKYVLFNTTYN